VFSKALGLTGTLKPTRCPPNGNVHVCTMKGTHRAQWAARRLDCGGLLETHSDAQKPVAGATMNEMIANAAHEAAESYCSQLVP
jgi:hypothetical protein